MCPILINAEDGGRLGDEHDDTVVGAGRLRDDDMDADEFFGPYRPTAEENKEFVGLFGSKALIERKEDNVFELEEGIVDERIVTSEEFVQRRYKFQSQSTPHAVTSTTTASTGLQVGTGDRNLLISRIKNGEAPIWKPAAVSPTCVGNGAGDMADPGASIQAAKLQDGSSLFQQFSFEARDGELQEPKTLHSDSVTSSYASIPPDPTSPTFPSLHSGTFQHESISHSQFRPPTPVPPIDTSFPKRTSLGGRTFPAVPSAFASPPRPSYISSLYHTPPSRSSTYPLVAKTPTSPLVYESPRPGSPMEIPASKPYSHRRHPSLPSFSPISPCTTPRRRSIHSLHQPSPVPLVGSYEESILSLRMSLPPSKPLPFTAQIGVLATGPCKSSLRCPHHLVVPFNAYFYGGEGWSGAPSPYVGIIDLPAMTYDRKARRAATGGYRVPPKGQVQIVIKNANKTGIKLFLVPYDLTEMPSGTKTFVRQKSFVVRPNPESFALSSSGKSGEGSHAEKEDDSGQLRYLIQLNFCSPSKGKLFLYKNVRVVFANRTLDAKEKLRSEMVWAEPKWSAWRG